jgi:hypothetical protein
MHRPGHVQGGQEAKRGYLLLGVYHRRIPGFTMGYNCCIIDAVASQFFFIE